MEEKFMFVRVNTVKILLLSKKGLSGVITVVLMIALVMAAAAIVWGIVNSTLKDQIDSSKSCFGNFDKVTINPIYTCYNRISNDVYTVQFSISIGDIDVEEVLVSIASSGETKGYPIITDSTEPIDRLGNYPTPIFGSDIIKLPGKKSGLTYVANGFTAKPDLIQIGLTLNGEYCGESASMSGIESCLL